jgi:hypothetical protein
VTFAELSIDVIIWISIPNKTYDLKENFTVPPEGGQAEFAANREVLASKRERLRAKRVAKQPPTHARNE